MTRRIERLAEIADRFDAVLVDQFGVLHDGRRAFSDPRDCLEHLARRAVPVVALTNSGKRAALNAARLEELGFPARLFRAVVSSGELAHARIGAMIAAGALSPGDGIAVISRDDDVSMIANHDLRRVPPDQDPKLLIIAGAQPETISRERYRAILAPLARAAIPALCINPDRHIYMDGARAFGPGLLARDYGAAGGEVAMLGKPGREMFLAGLAALGDPSPAHTLMIGDSPEHDVAGARAAGCKTLLVGGGVQAATDGPAADFGIDGLRY